MDDIASLKQDVKDLHEAHQSLSDRVGALEAKVDALDVRHEHTRGVVNRNNERYLSAISMLTLAVKGKK